MWYKYIRGARTGPLVVIRKLSIGSENWYLYKQNNFTGKYPPPLPPDSSTYGLHHHPLPSPSPCFPAPLLRSSTPPPPRTACYSCPPIPLPAAKRGTVHAVPEPPLVVQDGLDLQLVQFRGGSQRLVSLPFPYDIGNCVAGKSESDH